MKEKEYMEKSNQGNKPSNSPIIVNYNHFINWLNRKTND